MGILTRFTLRSLARNRARTAATVLGIALSCALITAIFTTVTSVGGGLLQRSMEADGSWQLASPRVSDHKLSELRASDHVTALAAGRELGSALLSDSQAETSGRMLVVKSVPVMEKGTGDGPTGTAGGIYGTSDVGLTQLPQPTSGRLPEAASEVMLPGNLEGVAPDGQGISADGPIELGSAVTLELGERSFTADATGEVSTLSSADSYATAEDGWVEGTERLVNTRDRTFTVVGFYRAPGYYAFGGNYAASAAGSVALVGPVGEGPREAADGSSSDAADGGPGEAAGTTDAAGNDLSNDGFAVPYLSTDFRDYRALDDWAAVLFSTGVDFARVGGNVSGQLTAASLDTGGYVLHNDLLRYQGITEDRAIWSTLWQLAGILTAVVMVASVSLIYTSFAISVTERMRQFGLLSGIGASSRQLRRTVVAEALALGVVGIPLGVALGIAGTAATLSVTRSGFAAILGTETGMGLVVDWRVIAVAAALSLVTLVVSAWVPAARAGRVSAVDAIRLAAGGRMRRRETGGRRRHAGLGGRLAGRAFGVSGLVAHRNLTRGSSRGRVVVASLAVSVALVVICGDIDAYMRPLASISSGDASRELGADLTVSVSNGEGLADAARDNFAGRFQELASRSAAVDGVTSKGSYLEGAASARVPAAMADPDTVAWLKEASGFGEQGADAKIDSLSSPFAANGDLVQDLHVYYVDDATWQTYVSELGLDAAAFADGAHPRAVGVNILGADDGTRYVSLSPFAATGSIDVYGGIWDLPDRDGWANYGLRETPDGSLVVRYLKLNEERSDFEMRADGSPVYEDVPVGQAGLSSGTIEVAALADTLPDLLLSSGASGSYPSVVMPMSALASTTGAANVAGAAGAGAGAAEGAGAAGAGAAEGEGGAGNNIGDGAATAGVDASAGADATAQGPVTLTGGNLYLAASDPDAAETVVGGLYTELFPTQAGSSHGGVWNVAADTRANVDAAGTMQLFVALFSVITMLIALANVFNTLTNSIILRTREFAVLKSVGMGDRAFARMIVYECVSYAWRGLAAGLAMGLGVSWLMWNSMQLSFAGLTLAIPWPYLAAATASAMLVLALSVLYALRRTHAQNLVEALRADAL